MEKKVQEDKQISEDSHTNIWCGIIELHSQAFKINMYGKAFKFRPQHLEKSSN